MNVIRKVNKQINISAILCSKDVVALKKLLKKILTINIRYEFLIPVTTVNILNKLDEKIVLDFQTTDSVFLKEFILSYLRKSFAFNTLPKKQKVYFINIYVNKFTTSLNKIMLFF